jgi:hypothetical protein
MHRVAMRCVIDTDPVERPTSKHCKHRDMQASGIFFRVESPDDVKSALITYKLIDTSPCLDQTRITLQYTKEFILHNVRSAHHQLPPAANQGSIQRAVGFGNHPFIRHDRSALQGPRGRIHWQARALHWRSSGPGACEARVGGWRDGGHYVQG